MKTTAINTALVALLGLASVNTYGETIGAPLISRGILDTVAGQIFALNSGFATSGTVSQWSFFNDSPAQVGMIVTPLLMERVGMDYYIRGVGTSRANNGTGVQSFSFGLTSGSDTVSAGYLFGWKDGTDADPYQTGVIPFDWVGATSAGTQQFFYSGQYNIGYSGNLIPGNNLGTGVQLGVSQNQPDRDYSVQATIVPEPSSAGLAGLGVAAWIMLRARH
jgi:hypothetical protein